MNDKLDTLLNNGQSKNVSRWFNFLAKQNRFKQCSGKLRLPSKKPKVLFPNKYDMLYNALKYFINNENLNINLFLLLE